MSDGEGTDLMEALATITRDERLRDELERMAAGRLSAEEVAALERRAASDQALRAAIELCRPRTTEFHRELARAARASLAAADPAPPAGPPADPARPADELAARRAQRPHTPRAIRRRAAWGAAIAGLAVAAAIALVVRAPPAATAALPDYTLEVTAATGLRADPPAAPSSADPIELTAGGRVRIVLRPAVRAAAPVGAWFFVRRGDEVAPAPLQAEIDPSGAVLATGTVGPWAERATLIVAIGPAGRAPRPAEARTRASGWRWLARAITVVGPR